MPAWYRTRRCGCGKCRDLPIDVRCPDEELNATWLWATVQEPEVYEPPIQKSDEEAVSTA